MDAMKIKEEECRGTEGTVSACVRLARSCLEEASFSRSVGRSSSVDSSLNYSTRRRWIRIGRVRFTRCSLPASFHFCRSFSSHLSRTALTRRVRRRRRHPPAQWETFSTPALIPAQRRDAGWLEFGWLAAWCSC